MVLKTAVVSLVRTYRSLVQVYSISSVLPVVVQCGLTCRLRLTSCAAFAGNPIKYSTIDDPMDNTGPLNAHTRTTRIKASKLEDNNHSMVYRFLPWRLSSLILTAKLHATSGPDWATIKVHQDLVRKQRVRERAAHVAATSSLPPRMAQHANMQAVTEDNDCPRVETRANTAGGLRVGYMGDGEGWGVEEILRKPEPEEIVGILLRRQKRFVTNPDVYLNAIKV